MATENEARMPLLLPFDDQSTSFVYGFEAGMVWQRMTNGENIIERPIPYRAENQALLLRMATVMGYDATSTSTIDDDYVAITFRKQLKVRPFAIVGKAITPLDVYYDMLARADWFHMMSDSAATHEKGKRQLEELRAIGKQSEDHGKLFNDFENAINNGATMPTRPEPKS